MIISVEVPVFKGGWLQRCIDSVLYQTSPDWRLSLLWDGGDEESRLILEKLERRNHPNVTVRFRENRGIARARRFLSEHSEGDFILPLDDDDALPFHAVERFLNVAEQKPWAAIIRGLRKIIDQDGKVLDTPPWFPFEPRHYLHGMVTDLFNHSQPYLLRRSAYEQTSGWEGFEDFGNAGEDCDIYLKLEEVDSIELLDEVLYYYRVHSDRASLVLTDEAAFEMWRRLADKTIDRIGLPLRRTNEKQPFRYERTPRSRPTLEMVDFVVMTGTVETSGAALATAAESLRSSGVSADAVHVVSGKGSRALNEGFRETNRPIVCILDAAVIVEGSQGFETLLRLMHERDIDLAAPKLRTADGMIVCADPGFSERNRPITTGEGEPDGGQYDHVKSAAWLTEKLILIRREVLKAVGGADEGFEQARAAMIDLCLKARQRDFKCEYVGTVAYTTSRAKMEPTLESDVDQLHQKWTTRPDLFERVT